MNKKILSAEDIEKIVIKIASPEEILKWSYGEVLRPETINYRTGKPDRHGLFSEVIFGPLKDYECACGKYKKPPIKGIVCERCGVEVTRSSVRRERMGNITLASPCAHIWFLRIYPYPLKIFLEIPLSQLEKVIYYSAYIITKVNEEEKKRILANIEKEYKEILEKAETKEEKKEKTAIFKQIKEELNSLQVKKVLSETEYFRLSRRYPNTFEVGTGAEVIRKFLEEIDLEKLKEETQKKFSKADEQERKYLSLKLRFINAFIEHKRRPEWMILTILPVIPPGLRPIVQLEGGRYTSSDLNELYRRIINRNNRLKKLLEHKTPEIIIRNEKRMLQEAVDALLDLSLKRGQPLRKGRKVIKSLAENLEGKEGRFRQNLLGKRVDYSGRSVIVVGPELKINECGLPKKIALELFKPFIIHELLKEGNAQTINQAKFLIESQDPSALAALEKVIENKYVLLNRQPTLHKLGILAFRPVLTEGLAIRIPPLVCEGYNADFDGDTMAVYFPLSEEAQKEARELMDVSKNLLKPGTGKAVARPQKDMITGLYYLTLIKDKKDFVVTNEKTAIYLYSLGKINLHDEIIVKEVKGEKDISTSVGRIIFNQVLPHDFPFVNKVVSKSTLTGLISELLSLYGQERTAMILDKMKELGFHYITLSGLTMGIDDLIEPQNLLETLQESLKKHEEVINAYENGWISDFEKENHLREIWLLTLNKLKDKVKEEIDPMANTRLMIDSGGRGEYSQLLQMIAFKGLVTNPAGLIIDLPITSSYKKGFTTLEYFISTHGARKGISDKALRTPYAGYLTRRLVDTLHDVIVREEDCKDEEGIVITRKEIKERGDNFADVIYSRVSLEDIKDKNGNLIVKKGEFITRKIAELIVQSEIEEIRVRSPFTCKTLYGVCQKCYGIDLSNDEPVALGNAVGILTAQSIGEPGTQLTLRTFHFGGVISAKDITQGLPRAEELLEARAPKVESFLSPITGKIKKIEESLRYYIIHIKAKGTKSKDLKIQIPKKYKLLVKEGDLINKGDPLNEGLPHPKRVYQTKGKMEAMKYIVGEIIKIYLDQGADIHVKYFELVVRKMFSRVKIIDPGDSPFVLGEIVEKDLFLETNRKLKTEGKKIARGVLLLMGIKNVALTTDSFLSAASFQETSRVLTRNAIECKEDYLRGIKENIIIGRKPPIGKEFSRKYLGQNI